MFNIHEHEEAKHFCLTILKKESEWKRFVAALYGLGMMTRVMARNHQALEHFQHALEIQLCATPRI
jgi:hypothetical protein